MAYAQRAAELAQALSAPHAAVEQWTRVVNAAERLGQTVPADSYRARGQAYATLGEFERAQADFERALEAASQAGEARSRGQSILDLGFLWTGRDYGRAGAYFQEAVDLARGLGDAGLQAHSLNRRANWLLNIGRVAEAKATHFSALALFEAQHDRPGMAETLDLLGTVSLLNGDMTGAVHMYGRAIELLRAVGDRGVLCSCLTMRASCSGLRCADTCGTPNRSSAECEADLTEALRLARETEAAAGEAFAELIFGGVLAFFGQLGRALAHGQRGLRLATEIEHQQWITGAHDTLARVYLSLLAPDQALLHAEAGLKIARELGSAFWIECLIDVQLQAYMALGQPDLAAAALVQVQSDLENPHLLTERSILLAWAELALLKGRPELALHRCERLLETPPHPAGETDAPVIPRLLKCQGEALAALGQSEEAIHVMEQARRSAELQGYLPLLWSIDRALGRAYKRQGRAEEAQQRFASARQVVASLAETIEDPALRRRFVQTALATLPKERPVSPRRAAASQYGGLTEREQEVAALIGKGKANAEIAEALVVSKRTVETYVSSVLSKLGFTSRSQIALWTREKGLVHH
jgi:DNA-binding CsgD family transcriptional regulator/Flp pilus assembly protein TadD